MTPSDHSVVATALARKVQSNIGATLRAIHAYNGHDPKEDHLEACREDLESLLRHWNAWRAEYVPVS